MELGWGGGCLVGCFQNGNPVQNTDGQNDTFNALDFDNIYYA